MKTSIHNFSAIKNLFQANKLDSNKIKKVLSHFYRQEFSLPENHFRIKSEILNFAKENLATSFLKIEKIENSKIDGASKILFKTFDNFFIETVILRIATGRVSICISSQCGCKFGCRFCATGTMRFQRNLTVDEIIDQIIQVAKILKAENNKLRNIVFMGMGEPFDNFENIQKSIEILTASYAFNFSQQNIMISTCGLHEEMLKFTKLFPHINLAISLHSAEKNVRDELMPINKTCDLEKLQETIKSINLQNKQPIMLEYLLLKDVNDSEKSINQLIKFCENLNVRINLISYNQPVTFDTKFCATESAKMKKIRDYIASRNIKITIRYSLGQDIAAACGQLSSCNARIN